MIFIMFVFTMDIMTRWHPRVQCLFKEELTKRWEKLFASQFSHVSSVSNRTISSFILKMYLLHHILSQSQFVSTVPLVKHFVFKQRIKVDVETHLMCYKSFLYFGIIVPSGTVNMICYWSRTNLHVKNLQKLYKSNFSPLSVKPTAKSQ